VVTARYALSPYINQKRFVFRALKEDCKVRLKWVQRIRTIGFRVN
jgi:hypothetical protein